MADGFDRSRFVLGMMDSNLLYRERLAGDDVFTTDVCSEIFKNCVRSFSVFEIILMAFLLCSTGQRKMTIIWRKRMMISSITLAHLRHMLKTT